MNETPTSSSSAAPVTTRIRRRGIETSAVCWCGQDMDAVRGEHCPRCGTLRAGASRSGAGVPRLAA